VKLNYGKPYHIPHGQYGVPPLWPEAKEGDLIDIHNGRTIRTYKFDGRHWYEIGIAYVRD
jgi:hypothetical protein